jgi:hypothetical protein
LSECSRVDVLRSIVVDYLRRSFEEENVGIAYIYCSYKEQEDQNAVNLVTSLLQQLIQRNPVIANEIASLYNNHIKKGTRPTLAEWSKLLESEIRRASKVFIVVDALDECSDINNTKENFLNVIQRLRPIIHLLVTSRQIPAIECEFEKAARVEIRASNEDITKYLESRIESGYRLMRHIKGDYALRQNIINTITEKTKGM